MALIDRFTRLFRADMHAVLDRMEEPDVLLRQAVREMDEEVARASRELKARELERRGVRERLADVEAALAKIAGELDLCFSAGNETLARTLLRRKLEHERLARHLTQRGVALDRLIDEQRTALDEQKRRADAMRQKAALFEAEPPGAAAAGPTWCADDLSVSDADVDLALLREKQQRSAS
ncbi:MAG TPA: PspA/IM30 family protein [Xanthomonadales bacterium]|nr:PspA/IM30 family protein [Xanthomonadales bacterium]